MQDEIIQAIKEMQEKYDIPHDQKSRFANDILDICSIFGRDCISEARQNTQTIPPVMSGEKLKKYYEETPSEQVDRENFIPLH